MRALSPNVAANLPKAARSFVERGVGDTRMEDVAEVTGIPKATLYYYFSGKEEILAYLVRTAYQRVADDVAKAAAGAGTGRERLVAVIRAQLEGMAAELDVCLAFMSNLGLARRMPEIIESADEAFGRPLREVLADGVANGSLRPVDQAAAVTAVYGAVAVAAFEALGRGRLEVGDLPERIADVLLEGLGAR